MSAPMHKMDSAPAHPRHPDADRFLRASDVFALLADPTRLALLWELAEGEADVNTLTAAGTAARPAVSQHLAKLRLAGLVTARKEGRRVVYGLRDGHLRRLIVEGLNHADHLVTGVPSHS